MRAGIDSGGTFTDAVAFDPAAGKVTVAKLASTPSDPAEATVAAWHAVAPSGGGGGDDAGGFGGRARPGARSALPEACGPPITRDPDELCHGTTVATNTLLEGSGARAALLATDGFVDVIEIGRQRRPAAYDETVDRVPPLVAAPDRVGVRERRAHDGSVVQALDAGEITRVTDEVRRLGPEVVAVCLLHAWADASHERELSDALRSAGHRVVASHEVAWEFREYERTSTTVLHAVLGPRTSTYLRRLADDPAIAAQVLVMRSAGGLGGVEDLVDRPADALLSGPAAGALAAAAVAEAAGFPDAIAFDMGGTSTDVCLLQGGRPDMRTTTDVGGYPCLAPALDVHTVGAGGGSIAALDAGGALRVGPRSAGAEPGPAAYGRGGTSPTVTDANVVLGRVVSLAGGTMDLDMDAARRAVATLGDADEAAQAIVEVVEAAMEQALRTVSVRRGADPADLAIVAFGGAGGLHAASLASALGVRAVIVPPLAGVLSAVGLLAAPLRVDASRTLILDEDRFGEAAPLLAELSDELSAGAARPGMVLQRSVDCRYVGQSHEIEVPIGDVDGPDGVARHFAELHEDRNGYRRDDTPVQFVTWRVSATVASGISVADVLAASVRGRRLPEPEVRGPYLLAEAESTTWIPPGFTATEDHLGNVVVNRDRS